MIEDDSELLKGSKNDENIIARYNNIKNRKRKARKRNKSDENDFEEEEEEDEQDGDEDEDARYCVLKRILSSNLKK